MCAEGVRITSAIIIYPLTAHKINKHNFPTGRTKCIVLCCTVLYNTVHTCVVKCTRPGFAGNTYNRLQVVEVFSVKAFATCIAAVPAGRLLELLPRQHDDVSLPEGEDVVVERHGGGPNGTAAVWEAEGVYSSFQDRLAKVVKALRKASK